MDLNHLLPFISTLITFCFAAAVLNRYRLGRKPHSLMWGIGLVLYGLGTLAEAYLALRWNSGLLRLWYLCGAMLTAAWLGQGTIYLLIRKRGVANGVAVGLLLVSLLAGWAVFTAPVNGAAFQAGVPISTQYKELLSRTGLMILLTILLNIYGTLTLVGGALWSAYLFARKHVLPNRMLGNVFIAVGALLPASAGTLIRLGWGDWLYISELFGAALMFFGFWLATQPQPSDQPRRVTARA
ncbi:MAG: hypothetical protein ABI847_13865 [Anaerolineales bacterium]